MSDDRVIFQRVVSEDGRAIAEGYSEVNTSKNSDSNGTQSVRVQVSSLGASSSASSSARVVSR